MASLQFFLTWTLIAVFTIVSAVDFLGPTNNTLDSADNGDRYVLQLDNLVDSRLSILLSGSDTKIEMGLLVLVESADVAGFSNSSIPFLSCDPSVYTDTANATTILNTLLAEATVDSILLYSRTSVRCFLAPLMNSAASSESPHIFSLVSMDAANRIYEHLQSFGPDFISLRQASLIVSNSPEHLQHDRSSRSPLGPSPSTTVAMIILYSITGVITVLFIIIIVTGAIRAHRNPELYGPRDVLGRARQSRAKGLARAMLDTLPIVKFGGGENKSDVEMVGTRMDSTEEQVHIVAEGSQESTRNESRDGPSQIAASAVANDDVSSNVVSNNTVPSATAPKDECAGGIEPAIPAINLEVNAEQNLGCSICTDDFEQGQDIRVLPCDHKFHPACIDPWLLNISGTCPLCRIDLNPHSAEEAPADQNSEFPASSANVDGSSQSSITGLPSPPLLTPSSRPLSSIFALSSHLRRPEVSMEERLAALRGFRERNNDGTRATIGEGGNAEGSSQNRDGDVGQENNVESSGADREGRKKKRITALLAETWNIKTWRR